MNVWNEIKRAYEIQKELTEIPMVQVKKGSRQRRWILESEKMHLLMSINTEREMGNWLQKVLIDIALWGLNEPFIVDKVVSKIK